MDDPWQHIPQVGGSAPRRRALPDRMVRFLLVATVVILALMPFLIVAALWIMLAIR